ncbi:MAG: Gfo/Idh/MocA family protein [Candidatus Malihini olakiniferum]
MQKSFAQGLGQLSNAELYAVGSRSLQNTEQFSTSFLAQKYYDSYKALVRDPDVDVVYIATPTTLIKTISCYAVNHGKSVLCEKPFTLNRHEAVEVIRVAREKNLFGLSSSPRMA